MCVHIAYILTHPKRTRSRYHASVLLLKVLCPWAPGNFCTLSTWPAHWPVLFMYVSACDPHPVLRFQVTKEYSLCHLLSFLSSDSVFLPVSSSLWSHSSPFRAPLGVMRACVQPLCLLRSHSDSVASSCPCSTIFLPPLSDAVESLVVTADDHKPPRPTLNLLVTWDASLHFHLCLPSTSL